MTVGAVVGEVLGILGGLAMFIDKQVAQAAMVPFMHPVLKHVPTAVITPSMKVFSDSSTSMMNSVSRSPCGAGVDATVGMMGGTTGVGAGAGLRLLPLPLPLRASASWTSCRSTTAPNRHSKNLFMVTQDSSGI